MNISNTTKLISRIGGPKGNSLLQEEQDYYNIRPTSGNVFLGASDISIFRGGCITRPLEMYF